MTKIRLRKASREHLDLLVEMNQQLMQDEAYDVPPDQVELRRRWDGFLGDGFRVFLFEPVQRDESTVGYGVVNIERSPFYLRHFFICRPFRRQGYGQAAMRSLYAELGCRELDVEVMAWNEEGKAFWRSLGFQHRYEGLRWTKP